MTINNNNMGIIFLALCLLTSSGSKNLSSQHAASIACEFAGTCKVPHLTKHGFNEVKIPWSQWGEDTMHGANAAILQSKQRLIKAQNMGNKFLKAT